MNIITQNQWIRAIAGQWGSAVSQARARAPVGDRAALETAAVAQVERALVRQSFEEPLRAQGFHVRALRAEVMAHGNGPPTPWGYGVGWVSWHEGGGDHVAAAAEVVQAGATYDPLLRAATDGCGTMHDALVAIASAAGGAPPYEVAWQLAWACARAEPYMGFVQGRRDAPQVLSHVECLWLAGGGFDIEAIYDEVAPGRGGTPGGSSHDNDENIEPGL